MAILVNLFTRFKKEIETSDHHTDNSLKTHYYKANFNQLFEAVEEMFRQDADCRIATVLKEHGEIAVEILKPFPCFLVATVISEAPIKTAVDFKLSTEKVSLSGVNPQLKKRIIVCYEKLNQVHSLIQ